MKRSFLKKETRLISGISLLMGIRMLGNSMIIPVFSIFATEIESSTKVLAGLAVGIFGISQTIFQIPMGRLSDRWGRKNTTVLGLTVFMLGTLFSGLSTDIYQLIFARLIAGAGAISSVTLTWATDGLPLDRRNRALGYVGMSIGLSVILGFSISPIIAGRFGISSLFFICGFMTAAALIYSMAFLDNPVPDKIPGRASPHADTDSPDSILRNRDLMRLNLTGFIGNVILTAIFFIMPLLMKQKIEIPHMWKIYVPMALAGTGLMFYFSRKADLEGTRKTVLIALVFEFTGIATAILSQSLYPLFAAFILVYSGHCILSPVLPAAVSRYPGTGRAGTVMGIFNSFQFIGSGVGGILSGFLLNISPESLFIVLLVLISAGIYLTAGYREFR